MANFYARDRVYSDYHLELPIEKMAQKELKKGANKVDQLKANQALIKSQKADYISALNTKYKHERENLKENWKLTQDNYDLIFEQEQRNAQREFENLQVSRGNPGPKQIQNKGLGSLMEMAPALMEMVGNYVEQEKAFRNKATTNLIIEKNISGATAAKWAENKELIASNSFEAKIYAQEQARMLGVEVTTEEMLSIIELYGERDMAAMTAFAHNSAPLYQGFLADPDNQSMEIVFDGGVTKTWGDIRRGRDPEEFAAAQRQMRGHFLEKHQISITDQVPGILGPIGENIRRVEAQETGRFHNQLEQYRQDYLETHDLTRFNNARNEGPAAMASFQQLWAHENQTYDGKPDYNGAFNMMTHNLREGIKSGTVNSIDIENFRKANSDHMSPWKEDEINALADLAQVKEFQKRNLEEKVEAARQSRGGEAAIDFYYSPDGMNGKLSMPLDMWKAQMADAGLTRETIAHVISRTQTTGGLKAQMPSERYKAEFDAGESDAILAIRAQVAKNNEIVLGDSESIKNLVGYNMLENRVKAYYNQEFSRLLRERGDSNISSIMQDAKNNTVAWLEANPDYVTLNPPKRIDPVTGEEIALANKERSFTRFQTQSREKPWLSLAIDSLNDTPGVSPAARIEGIVDGTYDAVIAREHVMSFYQGGSWNVRAFENSAIGRELARRTGLPASYILDIHAQEYGVPRPNKDEVLTKEELNKLPIGIQQVLNHQSSVSAEVARAGIQPEYRQLSPWMQVNNPTSASTVVGGYDLSSSDTPVTGQALAYAILGGEGGWDSINPGIVDRRISKSTAAEAWRIAMSYTSGSSAMGAFQHMPSINNKNVLKQRWEAAGLDWENDLFSPENQVKMNWHFIKSIYPGVEQDLAAGNLRRVMSKLRGTWPSIPGGSQINAHSAGFEDRYYKYLKGYRLNDYGTGMPSNYKGGYRGALEV